MTTSEWEVKLSAAAEADIREIAYWTRRRFGIQQAVAYRQALTAALGALRAGPGIVGGRSREDIGPGYRSLHVARGRWRARHYILFRIVEPPEQRIIAVARILHDAMDAGRHVPSDED